MLVGFLRFVIGFVIIYYFLKVITKYIFPLIFGKFYGNRQTFDTDWKRNNYQSRKNEGKITIENFSNTKKKTSRDIGEYVDFEEIKD